MRVCILALVIRLANGIFSASHYIVICGLSGATVSFTLSHKRHDFRKNVIEHKMRVLIFSTSLSQTFLILRRIQRDIINVHRSLRKSPVILAAF
jgi:hypothetical protein